MWRHVAAEIIGDRRDTIRSVVCALIDRVSMRVPPMAVRHLVIGSREAGIDTQRELKIRGPSQQH